MSKVLSENLQEAFSVRVYDVEENGLLAEIRSHSHAPGYRESRPVPNARFVRQLTSGINSTISFKSLASEY